MTERKDKNGHSNTYHVGDKLRRRLSYKKKNSFSNFKEQELTTPVNIRPTRSNSLSAIERLQVTPSRRSSFRSLFKVRNWIATNRRGLNSGNSKEQCSIGKTNDRDVRRSSTIYEVNSRQYSSSSTSGVSSFSSNDDYDVINSPTDLLPVAILEDEFEFINSIVDDTPPKKRTMTAPMVRSQTLNDLPMSPRTKVMASWNTVDLPDHNSNVIKDKTKNRHSVTQDTLTVRYKNRRNTKAQSRPSTPDANQILKAKLTQLLKTTQLEQLSKLQNKHQQEVDLLEDIRNFGKQKSQLERDYGQALQKLVAQYNKRDWPTANKESNHLSVLTVWKSVLDATEKAAQARINAAEKYKNGIYESIKNFLIQKEINLKKCQDLLNTLQNEISETVKDLTKAKKKYYENEQEAADRREKFKEVEEKLKKNQPGIFKSKAALERTSVKLEQKRDECNRSSTIARNEYLLMLSAANSHQKRYYEQDMPECIQILDGCVYDKVQEYLSSISRYELESSGISQEACTVSLQKSTMINREHSTRVFLKENPVFEWGPKYSYEACGDDPNTGTLLVEEGASDDNSLNREARKWASRVVRERRQILKLQKLRQNLESFREKYKENPGLATEANVLDTNTRLEKCREDIRKFETSALKSDARLELLRNSQIDVDKWIESATVQAAKEFPMTPVEPKKFSELKSPDINGRLPSHAEDDSSFFEDEEFDDTTFDETFDDTMNGLPDDEVSLSASEHSRNYPVSCTVIFGYTGTRADELTIIPGDVIEVVEDGDLEQWVKARDCNGNVGYVPENYLEFPTPQSTPSQTFNHTKTNKDSAIYSSARSTISDTGTIGSSASNNSSTSGTSSMTSSSIKSTHEEEIDSPQVVSSSEKMLCLAKAIYEYEGVTPDELSFPEGAIIKVFSQNFNDVDDGWWKGELNGKVGVFPALVVEELDSDNTNHNNSNISSFRNVQTSEMDSPSSDAPPSFRPPPPTDCPPPPPVEESPNLSVPPNHVSSVRSNGSRSPRPVRQAPSLPKSKRPVSMI